MVRKVCFAVLASVDLVAVQIRVICEAHGGIERHRLSLPAKFCLALLFVKRRWVSGFGYETCWVMVV